MSKIKMLLNKEFVSWTILCTWAGVVCAGVIWMAIEIVKSVFIGG